MVAREVPPVPESVRRAAELNYDDRAAYWEKEARDTSAKADDMREDGNARAATTYDNYAALARGRALSERKCWIDHTLRAISLTLDTANPVQARELRAIMAYLDGVLG